MRDFDENNSPWHDKRDDIITVVIADGITNIGDNTFRNCKNLRSLSIPGSITRIGNGSFLGCKNLRGYIRISNGLTHIGKEAFFMCDNLWEITIPNSMTKINGNVFNYNIRKINLSRDLVLEGNLSFTHALTISIQGDANESLCNALHSRIAMGIRDNTPLTTIICNPFTKQKILDRIEKANDSKELKKTYGV